MGQKQSFKDLKLAIADEILQYHPDFSKQMILITDASERSMSAVLCQEDDNGKRRIIHTFSRYIDPAQLNYSMTDKELLAKIKAMDFF